MAVRNGVRGSYRTHRVGINQWIALSAVAQSDGETASKSTIRDHCYKGAVIGDWMAILMSLLRSGYIVRVEGTDLYRLTEFGASARLRHADRLKARFVRIGG